MRRKARELIALYRKTHPGITNTDVWLIMNADNTRRANAQTLGELKSAQGKAPSYLYYFTWRSPVHNGQMKSYHTLDIPFVLYNIDIAASMTGSGQERYALAHKMSAAWAAFARNGNPNHPDLPDVAGLQRDRSADDDPGQRVQGRQRSQPRGATGAAGTPRTRTLVVCRRLESSPRETLPDSVKLRDSPKSATRTDTQNLTLARIASRAAFGETSAELEEPVVAHGAVVAFDLYGPVQRSLNGLLPTAIGRIPLIVVPSRLPLAIGFPVVRSASRSQNRRRSRGVRGSERSGFDDHRANHRDTKQVGLELHEQVVNRGTTVDLEHLQRDVRILHHRVEYGTCLKADGFECRAGQVRLRVEACEPDDGASGVGSPIGGKETREGRYEVDAATVRDTGRQRFDLIRRPNDLELIAEPLHGGSRDCDRPFECVRQGRPHRARNRLWSAVPPRSVRFGCRY